MLGVRNKHDFMIEKMGTWNDPTTEEKIVALEVTLKRIDYLEYYQQEGLLY